MRVSIKADILQLDVLVIVTFMSQREEKKGFFKLVMVFWQVGLFSLTAE